MNRKLRLGIGGAALVVVIVLVWFVILAPIRNDTSSTQSSIGDAQTELSSLKAKLAQAESTRAEGRKNEEKLIGLSKMIPQGPETSSLLVQLQDLAAQAGVGWSELTLSPAEDQGTFSIIRISATFTGTYFDTSDFVYRVEQMVAGPGRLLAISSIDLELNTDTGSSSGSSSSSSTTTTASSSSSAPVLKVSMVIDAFDYEKDMSKARVSGAGSSSASGSTTTTSSSK